MDTTGSAPQIPIWRRPGAVPLALTAVGWTLCFLVQPRIGSLAAPLLGPWAGLAIGHSECTMASALPGWSIAAVALGVLTLAAWKFLRHKARGALLAILTSFWALLWVGLALLSVVNTLS